MAAFLSMFFVFCFKQKTAYEMLCSDWSSDVCPSDLVVKNLLSKGDDKKVVEAMMHVIEYMNTRFPLKDMGYRLDYVDRITLRELIDIISSYETRFEFSALTKEGSFIK